MDTKKIIQGKRVLIVDDEEDVLETLIDLLADDCKIDTASSFQEAQAMLKDNYYHVAVLDIMGVDGYELLKIANDQKIPALMLTAHALSPESLIRSEEEGAAYYAPKEKMKDIALFLADIIDAMEKKKNTWEKMFERLGSYYTKRFHGTDWREKEKKFLEKITGFRE